MARAAVSPSELPTRCACPAAAASITPSASSMSSYSDVGSGDRPNARASYLTTRCLRANAGRIDSQLRESVRPEWKRTTSLPWPVTSYHRSVTARPPWMRDCHNRNRAVRVVVGERERYSRATRDIGHDLLEREPDLDRRVAGCRGP